MNLEGSQRDLQGDHEHLFEAVGRAQNAGRVTTLHWTDDTQKEAVTCEIRFTHDLPLNKSNADLRVNFLQCTEYAADGSVRRRLSWVTDLTITCDNARHLVRGGRARWKIENETFSTLKNQEYHFEHNFGHGQHNLSVVMAMLMMLPMLDCHVSLAVCAKLLQRSGLRGRGSEKTASWTEPIVLRITSNRQSSPLTQLPI